MKAGFLLKSAFIFFKNLKKQIENGILWLGDTYGKKK